MSSQPFILYSSISSSSSSSASSSNACSIRNRSSFVEGTNRSIDPTRVDIAATRYDTIDARPRPRFVTKFAHECAQRARTDAGRNSPQNLRRVDVSEYASVRCPAYDLHPRYKRSETSRGRCREWSRVWMLSLI